MKLVNTSLENGNVKVLCKIKNVNCVGKGWQLVPLFCALMTQKMNQLFQWTLASCLLG